MDYPIIFVNMIWVRFVILVLSVLFLIGVRLIISVILMRITKKMVVLFGLNVLSVVAVAMNSMFRRDGFEVEV